MQSHSMGRVYQHFVANFCPPQGVASGVGHHGCPPVVEKIYVHAVCIEAGMSKGVETVATPAAVRWQKVVAGTNWTAKLF